VNRADPQAVFEAVLDELQHSKEWQNPTSDIFPICLSIASLVMKWAESGNPYYMDTANKIRKDNGAPATRTIQVGTDAAAELRWSDKQSGTMKAVIKDGTHDAALTLMANLIIAGFKITDASYYAQAYIHSKYKASVLRKDYRKIWRLCKATEEDMRLRKLQCISKGISVKELMELNRPEENIFRTMEKLLSIHIKKWIPNHKEIWEAEAKKIDFSKT
jgi:hypothetical protein